MADSENLRPGHDDLRLAVVALPIGVLLFVIGSSMDSADDGNWVLGLSYLALIVGAVWLVMGLWKKLSN